MRYIGSKVSTRDAVYNIVTKGISNGTFCDPFGGIATMSSYFKEKNFRVYTSDLLTFANYFQTAKLHYNKYPKFKRLFSKLNIKEHKELLEYLNKLFMDKGWFLDEYSKNRQFFTYDNACKIGAINKKIKEWHKKNYITNKENAFLVASLIDSMDKVANTAGTYYAYLKDWTTKALNVFEYKFIEPIKGKYKGYSYQVDALKLIQKQHYDIVYLDPPYNERSYSRYYHLPEVIARQIEPEVNGKAGIPNIELQKSNYNNKARALESFKQLVDSVDCKVLLFHYTDNGLIEKDDIIEIFKNYGTISEYYLDCLGYSTKQEIRKDMHHIYMVNMQNG
jgi:adenine-specific DNA-methyltransferase